MFEKRPEFAPLEKSIILFYFLLAFDVASVLLQSKKVSIFAADCS